MPDLILRPSGLADEQRAWSLQLRYHGMAETNYHTIARVSLATADEIISAGIAYFLFGDPDDRPVQPDQCELPVRARISRIGALKVERAELAAENDKAAAWGAAVGARQERIREIEAELQSLNGA